jgi:signal transduction histidine kinase
MAGPQLRLITQLASINRVVLDLFKVYQPAFSMKRLATGLDLDPSLPLAWADRSQLELGLGNLLSNAISHTRRGGLIVCRTELDDTWVKLTIGDDGPGGAADELQKLVMPWGDSAEARPALGLDISKAIIAAHGGDLSLDRSRRLGTWFVVRLPAIAFEHARLVEQLEQSNRQKRDLVATLSHELRTPLNVIMGYVDLLLDGAFGPFNTDQVDTLRRMDRGARELLDLINGAIDVGNQDARHLPLELRDLHLPDLIRRFCQLATEVLGCDFSHIFLWQRATDVYLPVAGFGDTADQWEWLRAVRVPAAAVMRLLAGREREESVLICEPREWLPASAAVHGFGRCLVIAMQRGGEILGIMTAGNHGGASSFGVEQARLAQGIADLAALALDNARIVDELERVERIKSEFVVTMSHQVRIPLNVVIGYNDLLLDGEFGPLANEQRTALGRIRKSGLELLEAINAILDLGNVSG